LPYQIKAAGGVVIKGKRILFIKKNGRWEFPKGRLKKGAKRKNTAIREICEETGIKKEYLKVVKPLIPTHNNIKFNGETGVKETFWFLVKFSGDVKMKLYPEKKEGITKCKWLRLSEVSSKIKDSRSLVHYLWKYVLNDPDFRKHLKSTKK
jgi:8-oxo-dGTP pyrophosphatase MutT (NUDIX family)|tara:strand:- start:5560 stop:6012 length:453 start_codon:yes stop_codon:yes gene_type:complete